MAEKSAHLTQTLQIKPSLFDFVAQQSLDSELYPAIKRIVGFLAARDEGLGGISKWFDELFYFGHFLLQLHYLKKFGSTFSENFYGLKRVAIQSSSSTLSRKELLLSLFFCSVVPYLKQKLNETADKIYFDVLPYEKKKRRIQLLKAFIELNKGLNVTLQIASFVQHLKYLSGKSEIVSPFLWASGLKLVYSQDEEQTSEFSLRNFIPQLLRRGFEITAFFFRFCQWWQTERMTFSSLPIPSPPEISTKGTKFAGMCPICGGKRRFETALSVSGFVFCLQCISQYVTKYKSCPVTDLPADLTNLIRLYPPS